MHLDSEQNRRSYAKIVALAWSSESFKASLLRDPATILRQYGVELPVGARVIVRESGPARPIDEHDDGTLELTIPRPPKDLDDEPILSGSCNSVISSAPGFIGNCAPGFIRDEGTLELTLPPPPNGLDDEAILTGVRHAVPGSAPGFFVADSERAVA